MVKKPIDSFIDYFLDVKPYHTKILEVVEQYLFSDNLDISITENIFFTEHWINDPLCNGVGFGLDYDDECGFSANSCCDLFECTGGYGLIFDNSDILIREKVIEFDYGEYSLTIYGDHRFDTFLQIDSIQANNTIKIKGNHVARIANHSLFLIAPYNVYNVLEVTNNGIYVDGNVATQFKRVREFDIFGSTVNDDTYVAMNAVYVPSENRTFVEMFIGNYTLDVNSLGRVKIKSGTKNNGTYQRDDVYFDGQYTIITLSNDTLLKLPTEVHHGSVVFRTGLLPNRDIWLIANGYTDFDTRIRDIHFNSVENTTTVYVEGLEYFGSETDVQNTIDSINGLELQLRGYFFGAGFDGFQECSTPTENHLYVSISEYLDITENNIHSLN